MSISGNCKKSKLIDGKRFILAHSVRSLKITNKWKRTYEKLYFVHIEKKIKHYYKPGSFKLYKYTLKYNIYICLKNKTNSAVYCEKFKEVDPRVRAFQGTKCLVCEKTEEENGNKMHDHHVFYEKKTCCWINDDGEYWTNLNAPDHPDKNYYIGKNPNYFALLCNSCHGASNGDFQNRSRCANILRDLIDTKYGGKSYYTEEEMVEHGYIKISKTKWKKL